MKKRKRTHRQVSEERRKEEIPAGYTHSLHKDSRPTLVDVDGDLYKLVAVGKKVKDLRGEEFKDLPHVRHLNPIPIRTEHQQERKNEEAEAMHDLAKQCTTSNTKVTSVKKAILLGKDIPKEIDRLLKEKEEAKKKGDERRCRDIRKQLRKLDYKRYINKEE